MLAVISFRVIPAFAILALLSASAAPAASVKNRDDRDHKVTVIEGEAPKDHVLKPNEILEGICEKGCFVRLDDASGEPYRLESVDVTSIEDGQLFSDEPEQPAEPSAGETGQSSHPGSR